jgi:COMPASS component SPP1
MDHEMADGASPAPRTTTSKKKKGTAAAVKAPSKRARPGGAKKTKGGPKKPKTAASTKQSGGADTADGDGDGGNSSESDHGPYCLCRGPDDHRFMIACDRCEDWFHGECIGMDKHTGEHLVQKYICPNCTDNGRYATRYKKMCSLSGCADPARIYDAVRPSIFCSPEHCQAWWEQLIATLPRTKGATAADYLTQEEFMGLLDAPHTSSPPADDQQADLPTTPWHLGKPPFSTPPSFWDSPASSHALTPEEQTLLTTSATARYQLGEEIVLCKKMLQLIDLALKQREAAIAAGKGTAKDLCGYDFRLDTVGATHQFALFLQTPQGEAIFKSGRLDAVPLDTTTTTNPTSQSPPTAPPPSQPPTAASTTTIANTSGTDPDYPHMCPKKKCKPHNGWSAILTKTVRHDMKELAAQAKEMLDAEQRVRDGAAGRWGRRRKEGNCVVVLCDGGDGKEDGGGDLGEVGEVGVDVCY